MESGPTLTLAPGPGPWRCQGLFFKGVLRHANKKATKERGANDILQRSADRFSWTLSSNRKYEICRFVWQTFNSMLLTKSVGTSFQECQNACRSQGLFLRNIAQAPKKVRFPIRCWPKLQSVALPSPLPHLARHLRTKDHSGWGHLRSLDMIRIPFYTAIHVANVEPYCVCIHNE